MQLAAMLRTKFYKSNNRFNRNFVCQRRHTALAELGSLTYSYDKDYTCYVRQYYLYCIEMLAPIAKKSQINVIFGYYNYYFWNQKPTVRIDFQLEHTIVKPGGRDSENAFQGATLVRGSDTRYLVRICQYQRLSKSDMIIDYSYPNLHHIQNSGIPPGFIAKYFVVSPLIYRYKRDLSPRDRKHEVVTLFGDPNQPRRKDFSKAMSDAGVKCENIRGVYDDVEKIYRNTRVLVNIRQTDHHDTLEELRVLPALLCGVVVICEISPLHEKCGYSDFVLWGEIDDLPKLTLDVQANYEHYHNLIFGGDKFEKKVEELQQRNANTFRNIAQMLDTNSC